MTDIKSMTIDELKELMTELGDKPFRAKQIYSCLLYTSDAADD